MATITHTKIDTIPDWTQADLNAQIALGNFPPGTLLANIVLPSDWNAALSTSMATNKLLGRSTAGAGSFEEISLDPTSLTLVGGVLSAVTGGSGNVVGPASSTDNAIARFDLTTGKVIQNSVVTIADTTGVIAGSQGLTLTGVASPTYVQGNLIYDTDNESLTFYNNDSNVSLQIGQEGWIRVTNNTGSTIPNGVPVYLNGASGGMPTIALAQANAGTTTIGAGLTTEAIANGAIGYVTTWGTVRGVDTSAFTAGQTVYISSAVAGGLTATAPTSPNYRYRIGIVGVSSATVGTIHVTPSTASLGNGTSGQILGISSIGTQEYKTFLGEITFRIDGGGSTITTGAKKLYARVAYDCVITGWEIVGDPSGSMVIDVWKSTYASFPPTVANTITGSAKPTVRAAIKATSSTLTGWTTALSAGDYLEVNVDSVTSMTLAILNLVVRKA